MRKGGKLASFIFTIPFCDVGILISVPAVSLSQSFFLKGPGNPKCFTILAVAPTRNDQVKVTLAPDGTQDVFSVGALLLSGATPCAFLPPGLGSLPESWRSALKLFPVRAFLSNCPVAFQPVPAGAGCILSHRGPGPGRQGTARLHTEGWVSWVSGFDEVPLF